MAGGLHHVGLRGHDRSVVFVDDSDRFTFTLLLREAGRHLAVALHAYALLDTEIHLLVTPAQAHALGRLMQSIGRSYVSTFNRRHGRRGALWDGRFRCSVLQAETALLDATVLLENLAVERGLVARAADWAWSSAAHHLGRIRDPLITEHPGYWEIGNTPFERESAHANLLAVGMPMARREVLMQALQRGHVVGNADFVASVAENSGRPVAPRRRGRPKRSE
jgi:putative transposase